MLKKLKVFLFLIFFLLAASLVSAKSAVPSVYVNGTVQNTTASYALHSGTLFILPNEAQSVLNLKLSTDENNIVYTFSNPVRLVTYDSKTGTFNISDRHSFSYSVMENSCPAFEFNSKAYIPLRLLCEAMNINIKYNEADHSVHITYPDYSTGFYNEDGVAIACKGSKYGLVNSHGETLLPFEYDDISNYDNPSLFKVIQNHRCALASSEGKLLTDIIYNDAEYISPEKIYLRIGEDVGICDIDGRIIVPVKYEDAAYSGNLIAMVKEGSRWYLLNCATGVLSETQYNEVYEIRTGIHTDNNMIKGYYVKKNGKWGCIDSFGNTVIETKYEGLDKFDLKGRARVIYNGKFGIVDCGGAEVISTGYDYIYPFGNLSVAVAQLGSRYGAVNLDGSVAVHFEYDYLYSFADNPSTVAYRNNEFSIISTDGLPVTDKTYRYIEEFKNGIALAYAEGYGYIDLYGNEVIDCVHTDVKQGTAISVFLKKDGKWGLFLPNGENVSGYVYNNAGDFENGLSAVSIIKEGKEKYGYVNDSGDIIIPFDYSYAQKFKYGKAIVVKDGKHGIIDYEGRTVIPFEYTGFNPSYDYNVIAAADKNSKWGLIGFDNKVILPFIYDYIFEFESGFAAVLKDGKYGVIDVNGDIAIPIEYKSLEDAYASLTK